MLPRGLTVIAVMTKRTTRLNLRKAEAVANLVGRFPEALEPLVAAWIEQFELLWPARQGRKRGAD